MSCTDDCQRPTTSQAHCGACHRTFGGVYGFDSHRNHGQCLDPATLGMVETGRIWRRAVSPTARFPVAGKAVDGPAVPVGGIGPDDA